jgi:hypothetical protein
MTSDIISFNDHLNIIFQFQDATEYDINTIQHHKYEIFPSKQKIFYKLPLETCHFFSLNKDEQLDLITTFIKTVYDEAKQMRKRD